MAVLLAGGAFVAGLLVTEPPRGFAFYGFFVMVAACVLIGAGLLLNGSRRLDSATLGILVGLVSIYAVLMMGVAALHVVFAGDSNGGFITHGIMFALTCVAAASGVFVFSAGVSADAGHVVQADIEATTRDSATEVRRIRLRLRQEEGADFSVVSRKLQQIEDVLSHSRVRDERCETYLILAGRLVELDAGHVASDPVAFERALRAEIAKSGI
jgi:hypothetical protein